MGLLPAPQLSRWYLKNWYVISKGRRAQLAGLWLRQLFLLHQKVWLKAGVSKEVTIPFDDKTFRYFSTVSNQWEVEGGEYQIYVGANVLDTPLTGVITQSATITELPYDIDKLPSYKSGQVRNVHYEEFEKLYAKALPDEKVGPLEINDALCQMKDAKSALCRGIYKILKKNLKKMIVAMIRNVNAIITIITINKDIL